MTQNTEQPPNAENLLRPYVEEMSRLEQAESRRTANVFGQAVSTYIQPIHVVYGGANLFSENYVEKIGSLARSALNDGAKTGSELSQRLGKTWTKEFSDEVLSLTQTKLSQNPVEDYRIDFEDGYGLRSNLEEDTHAVSAAKALVSAALANKLSPNIGLRPKAFSGTTLQRGVRTLLLFLEELAKHQSALKHIPRFIITLPKVSSPAQVTCLVNILEKFEARHSFPNGFFVVELLIETPEAIFNIDGHVELPRLIQAASGRCVGVHFGVYDFTSTIGVGSAGQALDHFTCDVARFFMQVAASLFPHVAVSDGIINKLPIPPHRSKDVALTTQQIAENERALSETWSANVSQMTRSLNMGIYQGWDLHPSQVALRHLANIVYVKEELDLATKRLKGFIEKSQTATRHGTVFDDKASVLGLVNFIERSFNSKLLTAQDLAKYGLSFSDVISLR